MTDPPSARRRGELVKRCQPAQAGGGGAAAAPGATKITEQLAAAAAEARAHVVRLLGSDDMEAIDAALDRYGYLADARTAGGDDALGLGKLLHQLRSRRLLLSAAPRQREYTSLVEAERTAAQARASTIGAVLYGASV